ncbi:SDR family NAD(P)-dependent oxidoreductase [Flavobacterium chungangensis]|uniref:SDR family NAD(P)-dependent oxidoreductase n=1 Tax=Flavobacterium chungangensis TaxID=2708132 RepID=A0ABV8ZBL6_9FLAO
MKRILENKVVVITGASKGIGAGVAKQMAASGAKVVVNYSSSRQGAEEVVAEITKSGGSAVAVQGDISILADVKQLFQETIKVYGRLDALVNNAGIYEFELLESFTEESYRKTFDINVLGVLLASKEAAPLFDENGGSIINISSFAGTRPEPYSVVYAASKGAVDSITYALSQELGPKNIRVNSIRPGGVFTEGIAKLGASLDSDVILGTVKRSALGQMATPDDIGNMAVFFASDESKIITGQTVEVSGGFK